MNPRTLAIRLLLIGVWSGVLWAGPYKCLQSDGSIVYQETQCALGAAASEQLTLDPAPSDHAGKGKAKDYSIEGQLKAFEAERKQAQRQRDRAARATRPKTKKQPGNDRAKCAKNRAEAARWREKTRGTYKNTDERDYRERKLEYYEALVEQYCPPD
ncbi:hypothetical protein [uncultured Thiodictyon sp.]|uniref:hypothetical protein n=1 Tax=uncultured Thiodictyon sp. TaxID=1846217 RepID=UPI0025F87CE8|nr:hypothetical protein [uncultured Thiodictyon sp.]